MIRRFRIDDTNLNGHTHLVDGTTTGIAYSNPEIVIEDNVKISHKFRWVKRGQAKVLQCHENDGWVDIPFIEDPDKENFSDEINSLCSMD